MITPAQLSSNSSGLFGLGPHAGYPAYICQYLPAGTLQDCPESIFSSADDDVDIVAPDTEFRYGERSGRLSARLPMSRLGSRGPS